MNFDRSKLFNFLRKTLFVGTPLEVPLKQFVMGARAGSWRARLLPNHSLYPSYSPRVLVKGNDRLTLNLGEWMEWAAYFDLEDPTANVISSLIQPGDTVLDIGTNIGSMLIVMAKKVGISGAAFGFEPAPNRYQKCLERLRYEKVDSAKVIPIALGSSKGTVQMSSPDPTNLGRTKVSGAASSTEPLNVSVRCITLDEWVSTEQLKRINFIKIDVEGYEHEVLKGMAKTLVQFKPTLFIEIDDTNLKDQGSSATEVLAFLRFHGYELFSVSGQKLESDRLGHCDIIARPLTPANLP